MFRSVDSIRQAVSGLWLVLAFIWLVLAFATKPTHQKQSYKSRFWQAGVVVLGVFLVFSENPVFASIDVRLFRESMPVVFTGFAITIAGLAFAIWARLVLGANWSGTVTIKEDHALIQRGPYRIVRHPIYTGLLMALFGTAVIHGYLRNFAGIAVTGFGFWLKILTEESFMVQRFGDTYLRYRQQVRALIPFVF